MHIKVMVDEEVDDAGDAAGGTELDVELTVNCLKERRG